MGSVSVVLTSCNRFDLLQKTLESFFKYNTYPISQFIIIEDSHNVKKLNNILQKFTHIDFVVLWNAPQIGQMKSIEKAYSYVTSEYIFHCEDDWEFYRTSFIEDSLEILNSNKKIVTVWLREQNDTNSHPIDAQIYTAKDNDKVKYQLLQVNHKRKKNSLEWHGFTFNPGLRRYSDYRLVAPISKYSGERELSEKYFQLGYRAAIVKKGYIRHIGFHRGIRYSISTYKILKDMSVYIRKCKAKFINNMK